MLITHRHINKKKRNKSGDAKLYTDVHLYMIYYLGSNVNYKQI